MRKDVTITSVLALLLVNGLIGCTSAKKVATAEGIAELQQMSSAVQDMNIVVSAGVTKDEYSKRLTDALLKFGDGDAGCKQAIPKFPQGEQQSMATDICQHLSTAMNAYTYAKECRGPKPSRFDSDFMVYTLTEEEYAGAKNKFPSLEPLTIAETNKEGYKFYRRSDMVQALWKVAGQEFQLANPALAQLTQM